LIGVKYCLLDSPLLMLHGTLDEIACRAFPLTLKTLAKDWFEGLDPKFVDNFKTLGCLFLVVRKFKKNLAYLLSLQQGKDKLLKDYMLRFNREKLTVEKVNDEIVLQLR
jgi:hypothetical protein